ncbi:MAG: alr [Hydrocarboniphaga sp.]|uniref:alanine racemase n=1 Tax=Hydrocarboniphaga sp. TaxID=2033016 RepID=UPI0026398190|nr:alanine racemase [Hydrocarboniphaga sp.]MDB5968934.1 alr [Hydrocarboniphaga sp.]
MSDRVIATVDLAAIRHNLQQVRRFAPGSRVMAAVKADAYGHGAVPVARTLEAAGVDALAVACIEEALELREAHVRAPIALLEGVLSAEEATLAAYERLQIVLNDFWQIDLLESMPPSASLQIWFKLDSGMHRLGFPLSAVPRLQAVLERNRGWRFCGWMTHLACADEPDSPMTLNQIGAFDAALVDRSGARSIGNSAGILGWPQARREWVRPGLVLYGASPLPGRVGPQLGLKPALTLTSRLIARRDYPEGSSIGYGGGYACPEAMPIGVAAVGYADGIHRSLACGAPVLIGGRRAPLAGRVSMDMITLDLRPAPEARVGDEVLLWGEGLPAEEVAAHAGTLAYELFCGLTNRVRFRYINVT